MLPDVIVRDRACDLLDTRQAAEYLGGLSHITLQTWRSRREGPRFIKVGRLVRYRRSDLDAYLFQQTVTVDNRLEKTAD